MTEELDPVTPDEPDSSDEARPSGRRRRRAKPRQLPKWVEPIALGCIGVTAVLSPELFGGVFAWSVAVITGLSLVTVAAATFAFGGARTARRLRAPAVALVLLLAAAWTAVQLAPLPCGVVEWLAPASVDSVRATTLAFDESASAVCTISRDPGRTREYLLQALVIASLATAGWLAAAQGRRQFVLEAVGIGCVTLAAVSLLHTILGIEAVFGVYVPVHAQPAVLSPLLNGNNLAGILLLGAPICLGLAVEAPDTGRRVLWIVGGALLAAVVLATLSRGGIAALLLGGLLLPTLLLLRGDRRHGARRNTVLAVTGLVLTLGISLGFYAAADGLEQEVEKADLDKLELLSAGLGFALDAPWVGVGRGGWGAAFVESFGTSKRAWYAESFPAQWIAEWGFPIALLVMGTLAVALLTALRRSEKPARVGAAVGLCAFAAQNLVDFGIELAGVTAVAALALGAVLAPSARVAADMKPRPGPTMRHVAFACLGATAIAAVAFAPTLESGSILALQSRLENLLTGRRATAFQKTLARAVRLHPSEPAFALLAGAEAASRDDPAALRWLNRAMDLAPGWSGPHEEATRFLWRSGHRDQALLQLREALKRDARSASDLLCDLIREAPTKETALRSAPRGAGRVDALLFAAECLPAESEVVAAVDEELLSIDRTLVPPRVRAAVRRAAAGDIPGALEDTEALLREAPRSTEVRMTRVELLIRAGRGADAAELAADSEAIGDRPRFVRLRARALAEAGQLDQMRETVAELRGLGNDSAEDLARADRLLGGLEYRQGNLARALKAYSDAYRLDAEPRGLVRIAEIATELGDARRAYRAWADLCAAEPNHPRACNARDRALREAPPELEAPPVQPE